jgi:hypothetical protein
MTTPGRSLPLNRRSSSTRRSRRITRFALHCEPLESRQLLSVGQSGFAAGAIPNPAISAPQISVPAQVYSPASASVSVIDINYGSLSGVFQLQVIVFNSGPVFSPTSAPSFGGGGSGLGTLIGTTSNSNSLSSNSTTGSLLTTSLTPNPLSITPLNPSVTSSTNTAGGPPVFLVPPPLAPLAVHLGASTAPATTISNSTLISNLDELPPSMTHFGQSDVFNWRRVFSMERFDVEPASSSLIDDIEPFRPIAPVEAPQAPPAPQGEQAPAPDDVKVRPLPPISDPNVDAALDLTDARVLTRSRDGDGSQPDDHFSNTNTSWSFSAIFGAAVVASGGYHLAIREADRFRGRWIPRWVGAERPTKPKRSTPPR